MQTHTVFRATPEHVNAAAPLFDAYRQFYQQASNLALARQFLHDRLNRDESVLLARDDAGDTVGFCQLYPTFCSVQARAIYALYDLYTTPSAHGMGVGRQLLEAAESLAREQGMARMDLTTAKDNRVAQSLYGSMGWCRDEHFFIYNRGLVL